ncbi:alpha/beta hydrolase [bacterium]|nr:alpha/beta hydrolase [bacterium]
MSETSAKIRVRVPASTPAGASIFAAADFNAWNPAHPFSRLLRDEHGYYVQVPNGISRAEFKLTRGAWDSVECDEFGRPVGNHVWTGGGEEVRVGAWCDLHANSADWRPVHTKTGDIRELKDVFSPQLGNVRDILIWLPPEYEQRANESFPVLYMHDGQNLFDNVTSFAGEWGADEVSLRLAQEEQLRHIIVGIQNNGLQRLHEYSPWEDDFRKSRGFGERYVRYIVQTVKPLVDRKFRTKPERDYTGIAGSSLGGLISLYAGLTRPDVFSFVGAMSPSLNLAGGRIFKTASGFRGDVRFWLDYGEKEFGTIRGLAMQAIEAVRECSNVLRGNGCETKCVIDPQGEHNEQSWNRRLPEMLRWWHGEGWGMGDGG